MSRALPLVVAGLALLPLAACGRGVTVTSPTIYSVVRALPAAADRERGAEDAPRAPGMPPIDEPLVAHDGECDGLVPAPRGGAYCIVEQPLTWAEAERGCVARGGHLASIASRVADRMLFEALRPAVRNNLWLGLTQAQDGSWRGAHGAALRPDATPWAEHEPNNSGGNEHCAEWLSASGEVNDLSCEERRGAVCAGRGSPERCVGSLVRVASGFYCIYEEAAVTFSEARELCRASGAELATLGAPGAAHELAALTRSLLGRQSAWLGIRDADVEGDFRDPAGEPARYLNFRTGEPNNLGDEDCVEWSAGDGAWNDLACSERRASICALP